jgi:hypothetical protein
MISKEINYKRSQSKGKNYIVNLNRDQARKLFCQDSVSCYIAQYKIFDARLKFNSNLCAAQEREYQLKILKIMSMPGLPNSQAFRSRETQREHHNRVDLEIGIAFVKVSDMEISILLIKGYGDFDFLHQDNAKCLCCSKIPSQWNFTNPDF